MATSDSEDFLDEEMSESSDNSDISEYDDNDVSSDSGSGDNFDGGNSDIDEPSDNSDYSTGRFNVAPQVQPVVGNETTGYFDDTGDFLDSEGYPKCLANFPVQTQDSEEWQKMSRQPKENYWNPHRLPGQTKISSALSEAHVFSILINDAMKILMRETNRYGRMRAQKLKETQKRPYKWRDLTEPELALFLALILGTGVVRKKDFR